MAPLDELLRILHRRGWWIDAWYPLTSEPVFECRIACGHGTTTEMVEWATSPDPLDALRSAMVKAGLLVPVVAHVEGEWPRKKTT